MLLLLSQKMPVRFPSIPDSYNASMPCDFCLLWLDQTMQLAIYHRTENVTSYTHTTVRSVMAVGQFLTASLHSHHILRMSPIQIKK